MLNALHELSKRESSPTSAVSGKHDVSGSMSQTVNNAAEESHIFHHALHDKESSGRWQRL